VKQPNDELSRKGDTMNNMTRNEFIEKYGDVKVAFAHYWKYTFTYTAILPTGEKLTVSYGGNGDDIYRHAVTAGAEETVRGLYPHEGAVFQGNTQVEGFCDY
jgi:hypothetical protein